MDPLFVVPALSVAYFLAAMIVSLHFRPQTFVALCGHETVRKGNVFIEGWRMKVKLPFRQGRPMYCLDCLERMSIVCGICARPIILGDRVVLKRVSRKPVALFPGSVIRYRQGSNRRWRFLRFPTGMMTAEAEEKLFHHGGEVSLVCCVREDRKTHLFSDGYWTYPGEVMPLEEAWRRKLGKRAIGDVLFGLTFMFAFLMEKRAQSDVVAITDSEVF